jgi:hydroxymethylglutaryl-CoA lyase
LKPSLRQLIDAVPERVNVVDVSARDGLQSEPRQLSPECRVQWIRAVLASGVPEAEAGSFVPPRLVPQMAGTHEVLEALGDVAERLWVVVPNRKGLDESLRAGARNVVLLVSATQSHSRANLGRSIEDVLEDLREVALAAFEARLRVRLAISMAFADPVEGAVAPSTISALCRRALDLNVAEITLCDTYGGASPRAVEELLATVYPLYPPETVGLHLHDTFGVAAANSLVGLLLGVQRFDASLGGLGGCPFAEVSRGNVPLEDLAFLLASLGVETGIDRTKLLAARQDCLAMLQPQP